MTKATKPANVTAAYAPFFKAWHAPACGPKPTAEQLIAAEQYGRPGMKATLALAMYLRDGGATNAQVVAAVGNPQNNKRRQLIQAGKLVARRDGPATNEAGHTVYRVALATAKAKAPRKAKPAKPAKPEAKPEA